MRFPLGRLLVNDGPFKIETDPEFDIVRLLGNHIEPIMKVRALLVDEVFVHSSAVEVGGGGFIFPAWGNTGKTNLMLTLAAGGARILSDDWTVWRRSGNLVGYPRPVNLLSYNLRMFPELQSRVPVRKRAFLAVDSWVNGFRKVKVGNSGAGLRILDLAARFTEQASNAHIPIPLATSHDWDGHPAAAVIELRKVHSAQLPEWTTVAASGFVKRHTACFIHENARIVARLQEAAFGFGDGGAPRVYDLEQLYAQKLAEKVERTAPGTLHSVAMPAECSHEQLKIVADTVLSIQANAGRLDG